MVEQCYKMTGNYFWIGFALPLDDSKMITSRHIFLICVSPNNLNLSLN